MLHDCLKKLNELVDPDHVAQAEKRMYAAVSYEPVDRLPAVVHCPVEGWPVSCYRDTFHDMEKMLLNELNQVWVGAHIRDDRMYTVRANYGVGTIASMFGCEIALTDDNAMPWAFHLSDEELDRVLDVGEVDIEAGLGGRALETERYYLEALSEYENLAKAVRVFVCDTQGPFDTAHLVMGHKVYTEVYDNPERVHRLLDMVTDAYTRFTRAQQQIIGENDGSSFHSSLKVRGATRVCDDSSINLSAGLYREFSRRYNERVLTELGGGWVHYCGSGKQILPEVLSTEGVTGINFGNPELQDIASVYQSASEKSVAVLGWPRNGGLPEEIRTGITLVEYAPDLDAARRACRSTNT